MQKSGFLMMQLLSLGSKATTTVISTTESSEAEETSPRRRSGRVTRTSEMNGALPSDGKGDAKAV